MIGDTLVITDYHLAAAARVAPAVLDKLGAGDACVAVSIAGESGSGKSEIAACLAEQLADVDRASLILCQDDYFRLPPRSNHEKRLADIAWVGPGEVRLDLLSAHVAALKRRPATVLSKPLVDFAANSIGEEHVGADGRPVIIVEGTYTTLVDGVGVRVFIDRTYRETLANRARRGRDPDSEFIEQVLAIEHEIISGHVDRADIVIAAPDEETGPPG